MGRARGWMLGVGLVGLLAHTAWCSNWSLRGAREFAAGDLDGVSVLSTGEVRLAPALEGIEGVEAGFVWDVEVSEDGDFYVATGSPGGVYRVRGGRVERICDTGDQQVLSVLPLPDGSLLAATAPDGAILRVNRHGRESAFARLEGTYVWDMALGPGTAIYCATGPEGRLLRFGRGGDYTEVMKFGQDHLMCVAVSGEGSVYVGTAPDGHVYVVDYNEKSSLLLEAEEDEVRDVLVTGQGVVYACTAQGEGNGPRRGPARPNAEDAEASPFVPSPVPGSPGAANSIYRIEPEGTATRVVRLEQTFVFSLGRLGELVLAGTGPAGRLMGLGPDDVQTMLADLEGDNITGLAGLGEKEALLAASSPAALWRLTAAPREKGAFVSKPFDAGQISRWGQVWWKQRVVVGQGIRVRVRVGNSSDPDDHWSSWSTWATAASGADVDVPPGRFAQVSAELSTRPHLGSPELLELNVSYRQVNVKPRITDVTLDGQSLVDPGAGGAGRGPGRQQRAPGRGRHEESGGAGTARAIEWTASDPNEDELAFDLYYRGTDEGEWKPLEEDIRGETSYEWDTSRVPDGEYLLKLVARDDMGRSGEEAFAVERVVGPLTVDKSPPVFSGLAARRQGDGAYEVSGRVADALSPISAIAVSHNAGEWQVVFPDDGFLDSREEAFAWRSPPLPAGEHVFVLAATDAQSNPGSAKVVVDARGSD
jgi:hypothetical protein